MWKRTEVTNVEEDRSYKCGRGTELKVWNVLDTSSHNKIGHWVRSITILKKSGVEFEKKIRFESKKFKKNFWVKENKIFYCNLWESFSPLNPFISFEFFFESFDFFWIFLKILSRNFFLFRNFLEIQKNFQGKSLNDLKFKNKQKSAEIKCKLFLM